eukprot:CAMPEP_0195287964 /NCGR_PEP_ID=MMETSP0707-20130614/4810_1 /TAXON_ID=33640 /ORGANISM="Asterionellopsis glacialis, Strain CCMP134" /LENGTH=793 /DNA_ID=CAMNT_0040347771 /DNA_START=98 /DNA_END=2479 /DNA_ORIENTATION=-
MTDTTRRISDVGTTHDGADDSQIIYDTNSQPNEGQYSAMDDNKDHKQTNDNDSSSHSSPPQMEVPPIVVPSKPAWGNTKTPYTNNTNVTAATTSAADVTTATTSRNTLHKNNHNNSTLDSISAAPKVSFASIMAQEEKESSERKQQQLQREEEQQDPELLRAIQESLNVTSSTAVTMSTSSNMYDTVQNKNNNHELDDGMDEEMRRAIQLSLQEHQEIQSTTAVTTAAATVALGDEKNSCTSMAAVAANSASVEERNSLSEREAEEIEAAIRAADAAEAAESLQLAFQLQNEENEKKRSATSKEKQHQKQQGNVRIMTHDQLWQEQYETQTSAAAIAANTKRYSADDAIGNVQDIVNDEDDNEYGHVSAGYRINASQPSSSWSRFDQNTIVGPNNELRTKHDVVLQGQANAHRLGLDCYYDDGGEDDHDDHDDGEVDYGEEGGTGKQQSRGGGGSTVHVGNKAFNSFRASMQKKTIKGVAAHGHGRATADTDRTRGGAMDAKVRLEITRAINNGLMEVCNGVVKEGKEAMVYHGQEGVESGGHDVAVKVFKRIQEFKQRGLYVDGDPRYSRQKFTNASSREQLALWAEKEYRNLVRANRAGIPVPTPLMQKENILFMRFLGDDGWPSPQLKELDMKRGSKKWSALYLQVMTATKMLYHKARLVHGDLSEYNLMVCPCHLVENTLNEDAEDENAVQIVMIDFGQAVDLRHPNALELLRRDLLRVKEFFDKMGVKTMSSEVAEDFVVTKDEEDEEEEKEANDEKDTKPKLEVNTAEKDDIDPTEKLKISTDNETD